MGNMLLAGGVHIVSIGSHPTITPAPGESVAQFCIPMWHIHTYRYTHKHKIHLKKNKILVQMQVFLGTE